jgi:hypothetical protein
MKKVLVIHYSQSDQLTRVVKGVCAPLEASGDHEVIYEALVPEKSWPWPWPFFRFLDAFPETVYLDPPRNRPLAIGDADDYDLIVLAYQVWFLSPSQPVTAFLQSEQGKSLLQGKPVITVIACRNMWLMAQEQMKELLQQAGARLLDNVALVDQGSSIATFITTPRWVLTGNKGKADGLLPPAGIRDEQIRRAGRFGRALDQALSENRERGSDPLLTGLQAVDVDVRLIPSEKVGRRSFMLWGKLLRAIGGPGSRRRRPVLLVYVCFLVILILTVVPITMVIRTLMAPLMRERLERQKKEFELPSGSGSERMADFSSESTATGAP